MSDACYFRCSTDRQTAENQFDDVLAVYERGDGTADVGAIRALLSKSIIEEHPKPTRTVYKVDPAIATQLAGMLVYVEQGRSAARNAAKRRPMFEQMKRDASLLKFNRLIVWKVSRLGRNMREVLQTVYDLSDLGVTVLPVKSQTGPITTAMGRLLWAIMAWQAEMENDERSEAIKAGQARAKAKGADFGRPRRVFDRQRVVELRDGGMSWPKISKELGIGQGTAVRVYQSLSKNLIIQD